MACLGPKLEVMEVFVFCRFAYGFVVCVALVPSTASEYSMDFLFPHGQLKKAVVPLTV
jgi:hypothetical protein